MAFSEPLATLLANVAALSLMAVGGLGAILPELHRLVVLTHGWLSDEEFTALFALAQAAPGPNLLLITFIGWTLGGVAGGVLATLAFCAPTFALAWLVSRLWAVWNSHNWFRILQRGLAPLTAGLLVSSAWLVTAAAAVGWQSYAVTVASAGLLIFTRLHPLWVLGAAGALGVAGLF